MGVCSGILYFYREFVLGFGIDIVGVVVCMF